MSGHSLPEEYKGFSTAELLALWRSIPDRTIYDPPVPDDMGSAMRDLVHEYAFMDFGRDGKDTAKIRRSKQLLAPYGIDPAPWADENGIRSEELAKALGKRLLEESKARHSRDKETYRKAREQEKRAALEEELRDE